VGGFVHPCWKISPKARAKVQESLAKLKACTKLLAVAWFDNSRNNLHNPDPDAAVL
jgi:hypothetical protein